MGNRAYGTKGHPNGEVYTDYNGNTRIALYDGTAGAVARGNVRRIGYDATNNRLAAVAPSATASQQQIIIAAEPCAAGEMGSYFVKGSNIYVADSTYFTTGTYTLDYGVGLNGCSVVCTGAAYAGNINEFGAVSTAGTSSCYIEMFGSTASDYLAMGALSSTTVGKGITVSSDKTYAVRLFADTGTANIGSGYNVGVLNTRLVNLKNVTVEEESSSIRAQWKTAAGGDFNHRHSAVYGSIEATTTAVDFNGTGDSNVTACFIAHMGIGITGSTVGANGRLCGFAAQSGTTNGYMTSSGVFSAYYAGRTADTQQKWDYGLYFENVKQAAYFNSDTGNTTGEHYGVQIAHTGTFATSSDALVALNVVLTTGGTAGMWASALYAKTVQGTTKNVNGYLCAAELELDLGSVTGALSDHAVLVLNYNNDDADITSVAHHAFIQTHDYGSTECLYLLDIQDVTAGTKSDTKIFTTFADGAHISHAIHIKVGTTPYWILCSSQAPSGT